MIAEVGNPAIEKVSEEPGEVGNVKDSRNKLVLSGEASRKIPYTLTNQKCHKGVLPEFIPFFANCGTRKRSTSQVLTLARVRRPSARGPASS